MDEHKTIQEATAVVVGATGLVGGECIKLLRKDDRFSRIVLLGRREFPESGADSKLQSHLVDFDRPESYENFLRGDSLFCTLGTTIRAAGSQSAFRHIDFELCLEIARRAAANGVRHLLLVTAVGANSRSALFYNRVKGELEESVSRLPFTSVNIFRPSLLLGQREDSRMGEDIGKWLSNKFSFMIPAGYRPIQAAAVARAMVEITRQQDRTGVQIYESAEIQGMVGRIGPV
jgi:uncharacterized protein YbjT (DUF2867 family)